VNFAGISPEFIHTIVATCGFKTRARGYNIAAMALLPPRVPLPLPAHVQALVHDPRLVAAGLLHEAQAGFRANVEPELLLHGLAPSSFEVLVRLARAADGQLRMSELATECGLSNSGLTRVIDRMVEPGWVERRQDPKDRRVYRAALTPEGVSMLDRVLPEHVATVERTITGVLDPDELATLTRALAKVRTVRRAPAIPAPR
jgi:MarR family transcriptional regulator, 2-MHQ and catechol-resistance regulon repressor